eukprot:2790279-Amphidinium_carterae.1
MDEANHDPATIDKAEQSHFSEASNCTLATLNTKLHSAYDQATSRANENLSCKPWIRQEGNPPR